MNACDSYTSSVTRRISSRMEAYCGFRSSRGTGMGGASVIELRGPRFASKMRFEVRGSNEEVRILAAAGCREYSLHSSLAPRTSNLSDMATPRVRMTWRLDGALHKFVFICETRTADRETRIQRSFNETQANHHSSVD